MSIPSPHPLAYGALALPLAFAALPVYVHVPSFYATVTGMDLAVLGGILLGARLLDAFIDPWLGGLADRVSRRGMTALALCPLALGFVALFHPPASGAGWWLAGALALTYLGYSAASVAYQAWGASLGQDSGQRTRLTAAREGCGLAGVVLAAALPGLLGETPAQGLAVLSLCLPPLLVLAAWISLRRGADLRQPLATSTALLPDLRRLLGEAAFRRLLGVFVVNGLAAALPATLFLFFVADILQAGAVAGPLLAAYFLAGAASLPGWVALAGRLGRVRAWALAMGLAMLAFAAVGLLGPGDWAGFAVICLLSGLALGADLALPAAMAADLGERLKLAGACFGVWNFVAKLNLALAAGLALPLLALAGYRPGGGAGLGALVLAYALLPLLCKLLALALLWRWRDSLEIRS